MIWMDNWLLAVIQLFDHTLQAMLGQSFISFMLGTLLFQVVLALLSSMVHAGRKI